MEKVSDKTLQRYFTQRYPDEERLVELMVQAMHKRVELDTTYYQPMDEDEQYRISFAHDSQQGREGKFAPTIHFEKFADHIADWLRGAIATKQRWLEPAPGLEEDGVQRLRYTRDLDTLGNMADEDIKNFNDRMRGLVSLGKDEKIVMRFKSGFRIVQLKSPLALDAEGAHMNNCTGLGGYDKKLTLQTHDYYSLRGPDNKPHVTFEVQREDNRLIQLEGKANQPPRPKYMPYVAAFANKQKFKLGDSYRGGVKLETSGLFEQDGKYYSAYHLPDDFCFSRWHSAGNMNLKDLPLTHLPRNFSVRHYDHDTRFADLNLSGTQVKHLPENMHVDGSLDCNEMLETMGANIFIGKNFDPRGPAFQGFSENLSVGGRCEVSALTVSEWVDHAGNWDTLEKRPLKPLPSGLRFGTKGEGLSGLVLEFYQDIALPVDMQVHGELTVRHCDHLTVPARTYDVQWFQICDVKKVEMAAGITVTGNLIIEGKSPRTLPENLTVHGDLDISKSAITKLPKSLRVDGKIKYPPHFVHAPDNAPTKGIKPADIIEQRARAGAIQK